MRIDSHHHLWRYNLEEFGWLTDEMILLRRNFLVQDLETVLRSSHVDAGLAIQARSSIAETEWLLDCAGTTNRICGVVGWVPLADPCCGDVLGRFSEDEALVGVREIAQGQPAGFLERADFNRGITQLAEYDLAYDILIYDDQLQEAIRLVDRHPRQRFILNHAAKPRIASGQIEPWRTHLTDFARRDNVCCKLSGLVTEANWSNWSLEVLRPYLDICVDIFGTERLLAGSDWPVCLAAASYSSWWDVLTTYFTSFSASEKEDVFGANTLRHYKIRLATSPSLATSEVPSCN
jgi:L-fuconolactonase